MNCAVCEQPKLQTWGPLDPKIWGGWGGAESTKSQIYHYKNKKIQIFPKIWGAAAPLPPPPGSGPHDCRSLKNIFLIWFIINGK